MMANLWNALKSWTWSRTFWLVALLAAAGATWWQTAHRSATDNVQRLVLLLPDGEQIDPMMTRAWQDAAEELGFNLETRTASQLIRAGRTSRATGIILPDSMHRRMSDVLIAHLRQRVQAGDQLMVILDAGMVDVDGSYRSDRARLSDLVGVDYAMYSELHTGMLREAPVWIEHDQVKPLQIPPGKLLLGAEGAPYTSRNEPLPSTQPLSMAGYLYGQMKYAGFVTRGQYDGTRLATTEDGSLVAGLRKFGAGQVMFVNLPLTLLKVRTDGLPLHTFLRYFAQQVIGLPQLSLMPQGRGALVMNWHIDDRKALPALERAAEMGAFEQGPYSIHLTVGPDINQTGDGKGMDLANNANAQDWVRRLSAAGHEIGSHGGWIHNWFGAQVDKLNHADAASLIERNTALLTQVTGKPVREYSAPVGNHPSWITPWLRDHEIRSFYFTGNTGMPPTRSYQDGNQPLADTWSFPVLSFGQYGSFEEAKGDDIPEIDIATWLKDVDNYCADNRTIRLIYFHPIGLVMYPQAFQQWLGHGRELIQQGRLHWMTMTQYTDFANRRLQTRWQLTDTTQNPAQPTQQLAAHHPDNLEGQTWLLPRSRYGMPTVVSGQASVELVEDQWRVIAGTGTTLQVHLPMEAANTQSPPSQPTRTGSSSPT